MITLHYSRLPVDTKWKSARLELINFSSNQKMFAELQRFKRFFFKHIFCGKTNFAAHFVFFLTVLVIISSIIVVLKYY